ncbi:MAG TPA: hypothetical protein VLZ05_23525 [Mycobacterium sp.]|nr:hypothetical protein [Mycobacterium sp.]HUH71588.1 hypothetical protein [Mycobacterium sp.]
MRDTGEPEGSNALAVLGNPGPVSGDTDGDHVLGLVGSVVYLLSGVLGGRP